MRAQWTAVLALALASGCTDASGPAPEAASIAFVAGSSTGTVGHALAADPAVLVRDAKGRAVRGKRVTFAVIAGSGFAADTVVLTDAKGRAATRWTLGPRAADAHRLHARADGTVAEFEAHAQPITPGVTYFGRNQYIEYIAGDLPIVITAPHGGLLTPAEIPDRTYGVTSRDTNTQEMALAIGDAFLARYGRRPHIVINRLHRIKLDANRDIGEAAQGQPAAVLAWREFHAYTDAAKQAVVDAGRRGFYVDLHGHGHAIPRIELGYTLTSAELALSDAQIEQPALIDKSTIRTLARTGTRRFAELLRGVTSLGALFEAGGYPSVPSPAAPDPGGADYFTGGYNVIRHGSRNGGPIDGVQVELHFPGVRDSDANRRLFAATFAAAFDAFMTTHYGIRLATDPVLVASEPLWLSRGCPIHAACTSFEGFDAREMQP